MLSFFPRSVLDGILNLIGSVSEGFPSYSWNGRSISFHPSHTSINFYVYEPQKKPGRTLS